MVRGQARDMLPTPPDTLADVEILHVEKTGALFRAAVEVGGLVGGGTPAQVAALARFGTCYGIAFQHADDRDDDEHVRFASHRRERIAALVAEAVAVLQPLGEAATPLCALARRLDDASRASQ
jgi:hypothetical protein